MALPHQNGNPNNQQTQPSTINQHRDRGMSVGLDSLRNIYGAGGVNDDVTNMMRERIRETRADATGFVVLFISNMRRQEEIAEMEYILKDAQWRHVAILDCDCNFTAANATAVEMGITVFDTGTGENSEYPMRIWWIDDQIQWQFFGYMLRAFSGPINAVFFKELPNRSDSVHNDIYSLRQENKLLAAQNIAAANSLADLRIEAGQTAFRINQQQKELVTLNSRLVATEYAARKAQKNLSVADDKCVRIHWSCNKLQEENQSLRRQQRHHQRTADICDDNKNNQAKEGQRTVAEWKRQLQKLDDQVSSLRSSLDLAQERDDKAVQDRAYYEEETKALKDKLTNRDAEILAFEKRQQSVTEQMEALNAKLATLMNCNRDLQQKKAYARMESHMHTLAAAEEELKENPSDDDSSSDGYHMSTAVEVNSPFQTPEEMRSIYSNIFTQNRHNIISYVSTLLETVPNSDLSNDELTQVRFCVGQILVTALYKFYASAKLMMAANDQENNRFFGITCRSNFSDEVVSQRIKSNQKWFYGGGHDVREAGTGILNNPIIRNLKKDIKNYILIAIELLWSIPETNQHTQPSTINHHTRDEAQSALQRGGNDVVADCIGSLRGNTELVELATEFVDAIAHFSLWMLVHAPNFAYYPSKTEIDFDLFFNKDTMTKHILGGDKVQYIVWPMVVFVGTTDMVQDMKMRVLCK